MPSDGPGIRIRRRVLWVDDEEPHRELFRPLLEGDGLDLVEVGDGDAALSALRDEPDLLITDILHPGPLGLDLVRAAKRRSRRIKTMIFSATPKNRYPSASIDAKLVKPVSPVEFLSAVRRLLAPEIAKKPKGRSR